MPHNNLLSQPARLRSQLAPLAPYPAPIFYQRGWWNLWGDIPGNAVVEAWRARGAASYAASKIGLVRGSVLTDGSGGLNWSIANGWQTLIGVTGYLISTILPVYPASSASLFMQVDNTDTGDPLYYLIGAAGAGSSTVIAPDAVGGFLWLANDAAGVDGFSAAGVSNVGFAGYTAYADGLSLGSLTADNLPLPYPFFIAARNNSGSPIGISQTSISIAALAIYSIALTASQVTRLTAAMAAL